MKIRNITETYNGSQTEDMFSTIKALEVLGKKYKLSKGYWRECYFPDGSVCSEIFETGWEIQVYAQGEY